MIPGSKRQTPEVLQQAGGCVLEFEDLWGEHRLLRGWLESATTGLVAPAKQRIRTEIEAHYREAVATHVAQGLSEPSAKNAALVELGEPRAAARRFRRSHLTSGDAKLAARYLTFARSVWWLLGMYLFFYYVRSLDLDPVKERNDLVPGAFFAIEFLALVVVPTACFFVARRKNSKPNTRLIVLMQGSAVYVCMLCNIVSDPGPNWRCLVESLAFAGIILFSPLRLWYKLLRAGDDWQEMPPPSTVSS